MTKLGGAAAGSAVVVSAALMIDWAGVAGLGSGSLRHGRYAEALDYLRPARPPSSGAQRGRPEGVIETNLGAAHVGLGLYEQALSPAERGLSLHRQAGDWAGEPQALKEIARDRQGMGAHSDAISLCEHALRTADEHVYPPSTAVILDTLGESLQHTGDIERGVTC